ncbi:LPS assembly lipoprotein LptE [Enterovirga sp.]|uniref:LPS assembly lipoprotein LptE n=1 Tax=Enterovirga sp. TaxID=2026350 RepID=UPI002C45AF2A|nr:LPS assembly lipoprotein LptE [Enterovirga sp.]HMO29316.1 LPS assembly lipoprotein LptE [Enterovirga sp.]
MSWSSSSRRRASRRLLVAGMVLALGACFRPLYGPTASGVPVRDSLAAIQVDTINTLRGQERLGHFLRSELIFDLDGSGRTAQKRYKLVIDAAEAVQITSADTTSGRANAGMLNVTARYRLTTLDGKRELTAGVARATATYFRDPQRFASLRAARDAEMRASAQVADDIKQRLAALFATSP